MKNFGSPSIIYRFHVWVALTSCVGQRLHEADARHHGGAVITADDQREQTLNRTTSSLKTYLELLDALCGASPPVHPTPKWAKPPRRGAAHTLFGVNRHWNAAHKSCGHAPMEGARPAAEKAVGDGFSRARGYPRARQCERGQSKFALGSRSVLSGGGS